MMGQQNLMSAPNTKQAGIVILLLASLLTSTCATQKTDKPPADDTQPVTRTSEPATQTTQPSPALPEQSLPQTNPLPSGPVSQPATMPVSAPATNLKTDENVILFPTNAIFDASQNRWTLNVHGWVFEPETDSLWRNALIKSLALFIGVEHDTPDGKRFQNRTAMFLVDNEGNKNIVLNAGQQYLQAPTTGANGHFEFSAKLQPGASRCANWLTLNVHTNNGDTRAMSGEIQCLQNDGISVISDIDDTIKDSNVLDKKQLLKKTFLKEFAAVRGMSSIYQHWHKLGYRFHYVSSSPWQLYPVLSEFIDDQAFPRGSMHLKLVRLKDKSIMNLTATPEEGKIPIITKLMDTYPKRRFILVGDSGEKDAEIYAGIAKKYKDRIIKIYIHNVTGDRTRIETVFNDLPRSQWVVFDTANDILTQHALLNPVGL